VAEVSAPGVIELGVGGTRSVPLSQWVGGAGGGGGDQLLQICQCLKNISGVMCTFHRLYTPQNSAVNDDFFKYSYSFQFTFVQYLPCIELHFKRLFLERHFDCLVSIHNYDVIDQKFCRQGTGQRSMVTAA
jgi:hypothetical protein